MAANNGTASYLTLDDPNPTIVGPTSGSFEAIQSRVDILSKSKKLPANLDKAKFDEVKAGLAEAIQVWGDAQKAFSSGDLADAVSKAKTLKDKATEMMTTLGMQIPAGAKG